MDFADLIPGLQTWARSLSTVWPVPLIREAPWGFQFIQTLHLLALAGLGGCVVVTCLRLAGAGMTNVPMAKVERDLRPWLWGALALIAVTGVLMAMAIAPRVYERAAFLSKIVALAGALLLSLGAVRSIASHDGEVTGQAKVMAGAGLAIWLLSVANLGVSRGPAPGSLHIIFAGWLIVMWLGSDMTRIVLGAITAVAVIAIGVVTYGVYHPLDNYDLVMEINRWALRGAAALVAGFVLWEFARAPRDAAAPPALTRLIGVFTLLAWVTVAAAGRWIGLGGSGG